MNSDWVRLFFKKIHVLGVTRCKEAIMNAVNEMDDKQIKIIKQDIAKKAISKLDSDSVRARAPKQLGSLKGLNSSISNLADTMEKNLLEELYPDRLFLKEMMADPILMGNEEVGELIKEGMSFLDQRLEFWRCRNPLGIHETSESNKVERKWRASISSMSLASLH